MILGVLFPAVARGQFDPEPLLQQARAKIVENVEKLPKYTCVQTVRRSRFETLSRSRGNPCSHVLQSDANSGQPRPILSWTDRFKLDVTVSGGVEIFSWAGAREFQSNDAQDIVGEGVTGTGDFGPFLMDIFGSDPPKYQFLGLEPDQGRNYAVFSYRVPVSASRYQIKLGPQPQDLARLAYEGQFWIDPQQIELHRLTIVVPRPPSKSDTCRIETAIDYQRIQIGDSPLLLPRSTSLNLWDTDGARHENRTAYASCRAFQSESVFRPEPEPSPADSKAVTAASSSDSSAAKTRVPIPAGITLRIALRSKIDSATVFAGDAIEGQLLDPIRARDGNVLAPQGAIVHGRIVRAEEHYQPSAYLALGLKFQSLTVDGREIPLTLEWIPRSREERALNGADERRKGIGIFVARTDRMVLDQRFVTEWKTSARAPSE